MRLRHLHISRLISYEKASQLQETLIQQHFRHKDLLRRNPTNSPPAPDPTILTFSTPPTYTVGRRYLPSFSLSLGSSSSSPSSPTTKKHDYTITSSEIAYLTGTSPSSSPLATFCPSPRGGLLTYHAPGQLTAYPIINLRTHVLTPKCYVRHLESVVIDTCSRLSIPNTTTTEDPGVWLLPGDQDHHKNTVAESPSEPPIPRKICALGVQIRRGITGHGIALNVQDLPISTSPEFYHLPSGAPAPGYLSWGFSRIVACGLEGKGVTWLGREGAPASTTVEEAARVFVQEFARRLVGVEGKREVVGIMEEDLEEEREKLDEKEGRGA